MHKLLLILLLATCAAAPAAAQDDVEYKYEIGGGLGLMAYQGDVGGGILSGMKPMASLTLRRDINPYMAVRLAAAYGKTGGSTTNTDTYYPSLTTSGYEFSGTAFDLGAAYEYNFWPYGTGHDYRGARRTVPYILLGLGITVADAGKGSVVATNLPLGFGVKHKIGARVNLAVEWAMHFTVSDKIDGVADPYQAASSGMFKNTDSYSCLTLSLTYSFGPKCQVCNKDE